MYAYGRSSKERLATCHPKLQALFNELIKDWDISIICGERSEEDQNAAVAAGNSKTVYPNSKHNTKPSIAVDAALYPIDWNDNGRNYMFVGMVKQKAKEMGIDIRCGADWDGDNSTKDQTFHDIVHFELI
jgi:hypothetical protein